MEDLKYAGWIFTFDKRKTALHYRYGSGLGACSCPDCTNYRENTGNLRTELKTFLSALGIDISKPEELWVCSENNAQNTVEYFAYYSVSGIALSDTDDELMIGSVLVTPGKSCNTYLSEPYFILELSGLWLPWTVENNA